MRSTTHTQTSLPPLDPPTRIQIHWVLAILIFLAGTALPGTTAADTDPGTIYQQACLPCHGPDGRGLAVDSPVRANFSPPPAPFTEPLFNSREPAFDWFLVIKHGGKPLGLSGQMPAYDGAYTDEEIHALVHYLKSRTDTSAYPPGDLNFPRPVQSIKAFPEDEFLFLNRYVSDDGAEDTLRTTLYYAHRVGTRQQIELKASYFDGDDAGFKEAEIGWKWAFYDDLPRELLAATGLEVEIPIDGGDENETWIPYLSLAKGFGDLTFQGTLRSHLPSDDFGDGDVALSGALHWQPSIWPRSVIPGLEATLTTPFNGADLEATLIPQALIGLTRGGHVAFAVGVEVPLTGLDYDYRVRTFLLWDFADGPFWRGW